jgi:hypothetical protein
MFAIEPSDVLGGSPACHRSDGAMCMYPCLSSNLAFLKLGIEPCFLKKGMQY